METLLYIIIALLCAAIALLISLSSRKKDNGDQLRVDLAKDMAEQQDRATVAMNQAMTGLRAELMMRLSEEADRNAKRDSAQVEKANETQMKLLAQNNEASEKVLQNLTDGLNKLYQTNNLRLSQIQTDINQKLDKSLNERLDKSFETIGAQLNNLYKTVGELQQLTSGVDELNRTLSNVKTRGTWGEMQLEQILANIFPSNLYEKNVKVKDRSQERVEFALKIPDKDNPQNTIYLPIDSKFPADTFANIQNAAASHDARALEAATKELGKRIKSEADDIFKKYVNPPKTTDFGILFLPSEALYAEVLRMPGLAEECQKEKHVIIAGPTTVSALLNSLAVGFKYLTISKDTQEVLKLLQNIKKQYGTFGELIDKTQRNLDTAVRATDEMKKRSDMIRDKLEKSSLIKDDSLLEADGDLNLLPIGDIDEDDE